MDGALLKYFMTKFGDSSKDLAAYLRISETWLSQKINENGAEFKLAEIRKIAKRYKLTNQDIIAIFFADFCILNRYNEDIKRDIYG